MREIDEVMSQLLTGAKQNNKVQKTDSTLFDLIRRILRGGIAAILLFVITILCALFLKAYLSRFHVYNTKMEVMIMKEKDGNKEGSITAEVMSEITGWHTTYNKLDEIRIMRSRAVVEQMINNCHFLDSAYANGQRELGHALSSSDSAEIHDACLKEYTDAVSVSFDAGGSQKTSILDISISGHRGSSKKILVEMVKAYNKYTLDYANQCYNATLHCLALSIDSVKRELSKLDEFDGNYSTKNFIIDLSQQTDNYLQTNSDIESEVRNMQLQRQLLRIIRNYMADMGKTYTVVPANTGIDDQQINRIVLDFNDLVMRRSNYMTSMGADAMRVKTITNQIEDQRKAIIISIDKLTESFDIRLAKYTDDNIASNERLQSMPEKRLVKDYIKRERDIITPMYENLQKNYTETLIAKASEQAPARIVTPPYVEESLLFNNNKLYWMLAVLLGIVLAVTYLWKLELPKRELEEGDILSKCLLPIWGILPDTSDSERLYPAIKSLMTRVEMENAHIILITSGYPHDGKSFFIEHLKEYLDSNDEEFEYYNWQDIENEKDLARKDNARSVSDVEDLKQIISRSKGNGKYVIIDGGSYHENPELPILSREADATIYTIRSQHSSITSLDFCNYAVNNELIFHGATVICQSPINKENIVNFSSFDYQVPSGFGAIKNLIKKNI